MSRPARHGLGTHFAALTRADQDRILTDLVRVNLAEILGVPADSILPRRPLVELGLTMAGRAKLHELLADHIDRNLPTRLPTDARTCAELATTLWALLADVPIGSPDTPHGPDEWQTKTLDLAGYLTRIGLAPDHRPPADLAALRDLQWAHMTAIGFHNIDVLLGRPISLQLADIGRKLLRPGSAGTCVEHSLLFAAALHQLGFTVTRLAGRVRLGRKDIRPLTHMTLLVSIDGAQWLVDVGWGGEGPTAPVPIDAPTPVGSAPWRWRVTPGEGDDLLLQVARHDGWFDLYSFTRQPQHLVDYQVSYYYSVSYPGVPFANLLVAHRVLTEQRHVLFGRTYTRTTVTGDQQRRSIAGAELPGILADPFGVELSEWDLRAVISRGGFN